MRKFSPLDLRPTQFVLGMREIESKVAKMTRFSKSESQKYVDEHVVPIVLGPNNEPFMIDHHHFVRACWELGVSDFKVKVLKDYSAKNTGEFWNTMIKREWTYLHDQFGKGPHSPHALPNDIRCMADDPFRSLAWEAIKAGRIEKLAIPFMEFEWAAYFRLNLEMDLHSKSDFSTAIKKANRLAISKTANHLPGYKGK